MFNEKVAMSEEMARLENKVLRADMMMFCCCRYLYIILIMFMINFISYFVRKRNYDIVFVIEIDKEVHEGSEYQDQQGSICVYKKGEGRELQEHAGTPGEGAT